ncbi:MAG: LytTR family DNA-binding domain-containing protein [Melioribacteraceae bacterium]|nr:LytTR family DNA-binding domain-containing protein [Melioribacteraceae bacterium]MCF8353187.1 LytTR family DNA-binding domain-containing protein [Melioribacteraceae bacterium]MCF8395149.1 LytTR family DNA-binding domain-containing protein [Melioribacteraceae bacterium]MCF8418016.1 LytTR family DNA-binding domain-containing protein [Melioribacteraceae bacterium]
MKILIVDDEQPARKKLISFLKELDEEIIIFEAANGKEAIDNIRDKSPDLVLLDIQMPGIDGFGVIEEIGIESMPTVIFVTAYDQYAINAFEIHAADYLLKPFDKERFFKSFYRAKDQQKIKQDKTDNVKMIIEEIRKNEQYLERILVNHGSKYFFINTSEINYISAEEKYVSLHCDKGNYLIRETMNNIVSSLNPKIFYRVHRSFIVNVERIKEMQPWSHGDYVIILSTGEKVQMSRRYKDQLFKNN